MSLPRIHDALVTRLAADVTPVRRLWPPRLRLACWIVLEVSAVTVAVVASLRPTPLAALARPSLLLQLGLLLAASAAGAWLAFEAAVPGSSPHHRHRPLVALMLAAPLFVLLDPVSIRVPPEEFLAAGARCATCIAAVSAGPWLLLVLAVRRGAPLDGRVAGAYAGAAALLLGASFIRIACPIDEALHLLSWHTVPIALGTVLSALVGAATLERWRAASE